MSKFAERLRELRMASGRTQFALASALGISNQALSGYERGREPSYDVLITLSNYFQVSTDYILGNSDYKNSTEEARATTIEPLTINGKVDDESRKIIYKYYNRLMAKINQYLMGATKVASLPFDIAETAFIMSSKESNDKLPRCIVSLDVLTCITTYTLLLSQITDMTILSGFVDDARKETEEYKQQVERNKKKIKEHAQALLDDGYNHLPGIDLVNIDDVVNIESFFEE